MAVVKRLGCVEADSQAKFAATAHTILSWSTASSA